MYVFDLVTLILLAGATARITRLATTDAITERPRYALWGWIAQPRKIRKLAHTGADIPAPTGWRASTLKLLQCRWCLSFWVALATIATAWAATHHPYAQAAALTLAAALSMSYVTGWLADNEAPADEEEPAYA